jgi:hypothetical protein
MSDFGKNVSVNQHIFAGPVNVLLQMVLITTHYYILYIQVNGNFRIRKSHSINSD